MSRPYQPSVSADGGVWVEADRLCRLAAEAVSGALRRRRAAERPGGSAGGVAGVGISTFWHSLLPLDARDRPLGPVLLWADTRSGGEVEALRADLRHAHPRGGEDGGYHQRTGAPLHSSFWPAKLRWLARARPKLFAAARRWVSFADYLALCWLGEMRTSVSMASATGLWNYAEIGWDSLALAACGVDARQLPEVAADDDGAARLGPRAAERWPELRSAAWFPAWGDGACANVGSGAVGPERLALTVGTSSAMRAAIPATLAAPLPAALWRYAIDARRHLLGGALSEGGNVYRWLRARLRWAGEAAGGGALSDRALERRMARLPPSPEGVLWLPFLAGERSPGWRPERRAVISGLTLAAGSEAIARAALESVALQMAELHEQLRASIAVGRNSVRPAGRNVPHAPGRDAGHDASPSRYQILAGGAALRHSNLWTQIFADALEHPITRLRDAESSARGAALLAWERLGGRAIEEVPAARDRVFRPRPTVAAAYRRARAAQRALYAAFAADYSAAVTPAAASRRPT